jgi:DNA-binding transcriptional LysR family regulator
LRRNSAILRLNRMFDWNDLRYFLAVARRGSTIAAAEALKVNQSTVQRRLAVLEQAIGCKLVQRTPAGYGLTEAGLALQLHAEAVEVAVLAFERRVAAMDTALSGTMRITSPEALAYQVLTPLVEKFQARYPGLKVDIVLTDRMLDLAKGECDIALRTGPQQDSALVGRKIADVAWGLYASRSYAERHGTMSRLGEIGRYAVIHYDSEMAGIGPATWLREAAHLSPVVARCSGVTGALLTAKGGVGVALLPSHIGDTEAELVRMFGPVPNVISECHMLAHPDLHKTPRVRAFFDFMIVEIKPFRPLLAGTATD